MDKNIFEFRNYKAYLDHLISSKPGKGRGMRSSIAKALHCQTSYISQVLNEEAHFSLEQGDALNRLLDHSDIIVVGELSISWWRVPLLDG